MAERTLKVNIIGDGDGAVKALDKVGKAGESVGKAVAAVGAVVAAAGTAAAAFGVKAAGTFERVGKEVLGLQKYAGGSAQEISKLRFAAQQTGTSMDTLGVGLKALSRTLAKDLAPNAKVLGVAFADAKGKARPLHDVVLDLAEQFKKMPPGVEKNAAALKLFGRSGTDLLPFLSKGKDGLVALEREATKFGLVLSQDNLEAIRKNTMAQRDWHAALEGLQVQVGQHVLPAMTAMTQFMSAHLVPVIGKVADLAKQYLAPAFTEAFGLVQGVMEKVATFAENSLLPKVGGAITAVVRIVRPFGEAAVEAFNRIRSIVEDRVLPVLRDRLYPVFRDKLFPIIRELSDFVMSNLTPALTALGSGALVAVVSQVGGLASGLVGIAQLLASPVGIFLALAAAAVYAYQRIEPFRKVVDKVATTIKDTVVPALAWLKQAFTDLGGITGITDRIRNSFSKMFDGIKVVVEDNRRIFVDWQAKISEVFERARAAVGSVLAGIDRFLDDNRETFGQWGDKLREIADQVVPVIVAAFQALAIFVETSIRGLVAVVTALWPVIKVAVSGLLDMIVAALKFIEGVFTVFSALFTADWKRLWEGVKTILSAALAVLSGVQAAGMALLSEAWNLAWTGIKDILGGIWDGIVGAVQAGLRLMLLPILDTFKNILDGASSAFSWVPGIGPKLEQAAKEFETFRNSVNEALGGINDRTIKVVAEFRQGERDFANKPISKPRVAQEFATGGVVQGPTGTPVLALVHAGETILPTHDPSFRRAAGASSPSSSAQPVVNMTTHLSLPNYVGDRSEFKRWLVTALDQVTRESGPLPLSYFPPEVRALVS